MDSNAQDFTARAYTDLFQRLQQEANAKYFSGKVSVRAATKREHKFHLIPRADQYQTKLQLEQNCIGASSENALKAFLRTPKLSEEHLQ